MLETSTKPARYLVTGGAAAIVDIGGFGVLCFAQVPVVLAATCSFCMAAIVNFHLSSRWVFRAAATRQGFVLFLLGACLGLLANVSMTSIGVLYFCLPRVMAKTLAIGATFLLNF
jgi:putative flippase GtrA